MDSEVTFFSTCFYYFLAHQANLHSKLPGPVLYSMCSGTGVVEVCLYIKKCQVVGYACKPGLKRDWKQVIY
jgi:hypothetical protein